MKNNKGQVVKDRWSKKTEDRPQVQEKFVAARLDVPPLKPLNPKQRDFIHKIRDNDLILATGYPGTSKTYIPVCMGADMLRTGKIDKLVIARPAVSNSRSLGFFGGDLKEKMANWLIPVLNILKARLGRGAVDLYVKRGQIEFVPLEVIKGYSAENCFFICDEAEDISIDEAVKIVTRQGKNCKMILSGDCAQSELGADSGLAFLIDKATEYAIPGVGVMSFDNFDDIVRSEACKQWVTILYPGK